MKPTRVAPPVSRGTVVVLAVAAVLGLGGGSLAALALEGDPAPAGATAAGAAAGPGALLYADATSIHDGDTVVAHDVPLDRRSRLVRAADGWVLAESLSPQAPDLALWHVATSGERNLVARVSSTWDVDPSGEQVTGVDLDTGRVGVWTLDGDEVGLAPSLPRPAWTSYFLGDRVAVTTVQAERGWDLWTWRPGGELRRTTRISPAEPFASRSGDLVAGASTNEGFALGNGPNPCLRVVPAPGADPVPEWQTCDWRPAAQQGGFSPGGSRVMSIPSDTDGFGPGQVATFPAATGPRGGLEVLDLPDLALSTQWLDDDHLLVTSATDLELDASTGTVLSRCGLSGGCTEVARSPDGVLVAGEQY